MHPEDTAAPHLGPPSPLMHLFIRLLLICSLYNKTGIIRMELS